LKRYSALWRDSWWAWVTIVVFGLVGGFFHWIFLSALPIAVFAFFYFGVMRYDDQGNGKEM